MKVLFELVDHLQVGCLGVFLHVQFGGKGKIKAREQCWFCGKSFFGKIWLQYLLKSNMLWIVNSSMSYFEIDLPDELFTDQFELRMVLVFIEVNSESLDLSSWN